MWCVHTRECRHVCVHVCVCGVHTHLYTEVKNVSGAPPELGWGGGRGRRLRGGSGVGAHIPERSGSVVGRVRQGSDLGSDSCARGGSVAEYPDPGWAAGLLAGLRLSAGATYWPEAPLPEPAAWQVSMWPWELPGQGPWFGGGAILHYRSMLKPAIHTGFVLCFCSDKSYVSSLQTIWKKYECKKRRAITHRDTCQIRLETSACLP